MPPQHGDAHLKPDAGQEPDQHRPGQEIGQEAQPEDARQEQQPGAEQGHHLDQVHVMGGLGLGHVRQAAGEDGGGGRVRRDHQVAGRAEDREGDQRQEDGVETGNHRGPGDPRIAEDLGDVHGGQGHPRQGIPQGPAQALGTQTVE
jgi:hypothetical protein